MGIRGAQAFKRIWENPIPLELGAAPAAFPWSLGSSEDPEVAEGRNSLDFTGKRWNCGIPAVFYGLGFSGRSLWLDQEWENPGKAAEFGFCGKNWRGSSAGFPGKLRLLRPRERPRAAWENLGEWEESLEDP